MSKLVSVILLSHCMKGPQGATVEVTEFEAKKLIKKGFAKLEDAETPEEDRETKVVEPDSTKDPKPKKEAKGKNKGK